jgi:hypothetical protein
MILIFLPIPDPGSRSQKGTEYQIRIRTTGIKNNIFRKDIMNFFMGNDLSPVDTNTP